MSYMKPKSNTTRSKPPSSSNRAISANYKSNKNNLPKMLKDYQLFCQKYFGNTTPIASMSQERFEKVFNEENKEQHQPQNEPHNKISLSMLENDTYDFCYSCLNIEGALDKIANSEIFAKEQKLGYGKNDKNDYIKRLKKLQSKPNTDNLVKEDDEENYDDDFNFQEKEEDKAQIDINQQEEAEHQKEPIKIFDDNTHNIINEETKNRQASKIQVCYKSQKCPKRLRDRLYFGYDKTENFLLWIYIDKKTPKDAKENFDIISLFCKIYSITEKSTTYEKKYIKDLFFDNSIPITQIHSAIPDIIEKLLKQDKEENSFEDLHSDKAEEIKDEIHQSLSSIENVDYDNI